jgi:hypothetical protein
MALLGMPVLLLNMGGEMVYILEQRLQAQSINNEKSKKGNLLIHIPATPHNPTH